MGSMSLPSLDGVARAFLTPARRPASEAVVPPDRYITGPAGPMALWSTGSGPTVLLVHGWEGSHADLAAFVAPIAALGHRVVSVDLPAHGLSAGDSTSLPEWASALLAVERAVGPLAAVVAHSMGGAATALALRAGLATDRVVLIASASRYRPYARYFAAQAGVDGEALLDNLRARGIDVDNMDVPELAPRLAARALLIHSQDDRIIPVSSSREIARAWPNAESLEVKDLGHRRLLRDESVIWAATSFIGH